MAKKKNHKQNRTPAHTVFARIPPALGEALEAYVQSLRPKPSVTSVLQTCIEDFLTNAGFWPPPADEEDE